VEKRRILLVDDEESILVVLKGSLKKLGDEYEIQTINNGLKALELIEKIPFDVIVTDYQMADMNGLELLEAIRTIQPSAKVIMMTAYGSGNLEVEARRLKAYEYLRKPLEINAFREVIQSALDEMAITRPGIVIMSDKRYRKALELLEQLLQDVGARCLLLADAGGRVMAQLGDSTGLAVEEIMTLLGGGISTITEVGRSLDNNPDAVTLTYREGDREDLYMVNVGQHILLVLIIDRTAYNSRLGSVWYYAKQTAVNLRPIIGDVNFNTVASDLFDDTTEEAFDYELDQLWELA
jgi:CheY-like chemotaxis protein/predicted regulator of Ras-like GTPase activity (Roadblock/LC7/MglB family)